MKTLFIIALIACMALSGCDKNATKPTTQETIETVAPTTVPEETKPAVPENWPEADGLMGWVNKFPIPKFADSVDITMATEYIFVCKIQNVSIGKYEDYAKLLRDSGFDVESFYFYGISYLAYNEDKTMHVNVSYSKSKSEVTLNFSRDWDKIKAQIEAAMGGHGE